jgi:hypothetical protein
VRKTCGMPVTTIAVAETVDFELCGKPAVDEYCGIPMCAEHFDMLAAAGNPPLDGAWNGWTTQ